MSYLIVFVLGAAAGAYAAYNLGWNAAVRLYRDRTVDQAQQRAEQDWR